MQREKSRFSSPKQFWEKSERASKPAKGEAERKKLDEPKATSVSEPNQMQMTEKESEDKGK